MDANGNSKQHKLHLVKRGVTAPADSPALAVEEGELHARLFRNRRQSLLGEQIQGRGGL